MRNKRFPDENRKKDFVGINEKWRLKTKNEVL